MLTLPASRAHCSGPWPCARCQWSRWRTTRTLPAFLFLTQNIHRWTTTSVLFSNIFQIKNTSLTFSHHLDTLGLLARLADPCRVVGSDAEAVPAQRRQARADVVGRVFTTTCGFSPALGIVPALLSDLHFVAQHGCASVVAGARPGEDHGLSGQLGNNGLGCWWGGLVWGEIQEQNIQSHRLVLFGAFSWIHIWDCVEETTNTSVASSQVTGGLHHSEIMKRVVPMTPRETVCWAEPLTFRTTTVYEPVSSGQAWKISTSLCVSLLRTDILGPPTTTWRGSMVEVHTETRISKWEYNVSSNTTNHWDKRYLGFIVDPAAGHGHRAAPELTVESGLLSYSDLHLLWRIHKLHRRSWGETQLVYRTKDMSTFPSGRVAVPSALLTFARGDWCLKVDVTVSCGDWRRRLIYRCVHEAGLWSIYPITCEQSCLVAGALQSTMHCTIRWRGRLHF